MPSYQKSFPSKYLKAADFEDGSRVETISKVSDQVMEDGKLKLCLSFKGMTQDLVCNVTKIHGALGVSPAMAAGITDRLW